MENGTEREQKVGLRHSAGLSRREYFEELCKIHGMLRDLKKIIDPVDILYNFWLLPSRSLKAHIVKTNVIGCKTEKFSSFMAISIRYRSDL